MLTIFFDSKDSIYREFVLTGQALTDASYLKFYSALWLESIVFDENIVIQKT